jgi:glutamine amidotransferase-like uncharacterized protein
MIPIIYSGRGALTTGFSGKFIELKELLDSNWDQTHSLFIMPGGRDRPYMKDLKGAGNAKIRKFVEMGGTYLGICAGAYYGCKRVEFDEGMPLEVCEDRELSFFPGIAKGPIFGKGTFHYTNYSGARAAKIITSDDEFYVYYNGGCTFEGDLSGCKILAHYKDLPGQPPAIIECALGKGKAILSGAHLEMPASLLDPKDPHLKSLIPLLEKDEEKRKHLWNFLTAIYAKGPKTLPPIK